MKNILIQKFVELSSNLNLNSFRLSQNTNRESEKYLDDLRYSNKFVELIKTNFDSKNQTADLISGYQIAELPFFMIKYSVERSIKYCNMAKIYVGKRTTTRTDTQEVIEIPENCLGELKTAMKNKNARPPVTTTRELSKNDEYTLRNSLHEKSLYENHYVYDVTKIDNHTFIEKSFESESVEVEFWIIQYKNVFATITEEERTQIFSSIDDAKSNLVIEELKQLTIKNLNPNTTPNTTKAYIIKELYQELDQLTERINIAYNL